MPIYEVALCIVLTTMIGILFVSPIYLFERYILWEILDEYIDSTIIKVVACAVINVAIFLPTAYFLGCYADGQFWDEIGERLPKDVTVTHWMAFPMV